MSPVETLTTSSDPEDLWPIRVRIQHAPTVPNPRTGEAVRVAPASAYTADAWLCMTPMMIRTVWTHLMQERSPNVELAVDALVVAHHPRVEAETQFYSAISADRVLTVEHLNPMRPVSRSAWDRLVAQVTNPADTACCGNAARRTGRIRFGRGGFWGVGWLPMESEDPLDSLPFGMQANVAPGSRTEWQAAHALTVARCAMVHDAREADEVLETIMRWHAARDSHMWKVVRLAVTARPARPVWEHLSPAYWHDLLASHHPPVEDLLAEVIPTLGDAWWKARTADDWAALCAARWSSVRVAAVRGLADRETDAVSPGVAQSAALHGSDGSRMPTVLPRGQ